MKKLMIALATVAVAAVVQAATFQWGVQNITNDDGTGLASGYRAWGFIAETSKEGIKTISTADAVALLDAGNITELKTYMLKAGKTSDGAWSSSELDGGWGTGDTLTAYAIIFNVGDATPTSATKYIVTPTSGITFANATTARNIAFSASTSTWETVGAGDTPAEPEPTSALLMLCGLAGLALRRKRA